MKIPRAVQQLIESFERLPGIGPKSAQRLTYYLLHVPQSELDRFAQSLQMLKKNTLMCSVCFGFGEQDPCDICSDPKRDNSIICVIEQPLDVLALERSGLYKGLYHVLHGKLDPLNNIGPDEIRIGELMHRVKNQESSARNSGASVSGGGIMEIVLATNPTMEGEATAMYIAKQLKTPSFAKASAGKQNIDLKITRIGRGLPTGADLEYADPMTLTRAMEGRREY